MNEWILKWSLNFLIKTNKRKVKITIIKWGNRYAVSYKHTCVSDCDSRHQNSSSSRLLLSKADGDL